MWFYFRKTSIKIQECWGKQATWEDIQGDSHPQETWPPQHCEAGRSIRWYRQWQPLYGWVLTFSNWGLSAVYNWSQNCEASRSEHCQTGL